MNSSIFKIVAFVCYSLIFASAIAAQEKPQALKFDEFDAFGANQLYSNSNQLSFAKRVERFKKQLRRHRNVTAYVLYYKARISDEGTERELDSQVNRIQFGEQYGTMFEVEVITVDGGYRDFNSVEFWIVPKNAEPPVPTPTIDKAETFICPKVFVYDSYSPAEPDALEFSFSDYNLRSAPPYTLKWRVFGGEIVSGQESDKIKVRLKDNRKRATAYLEIEGLPFPCPKVFSATGEVKGKLLLIDEFGREANGQIKSRLDSYFTQIQNNPTAKSYIVNYSSRQNGDAAITARLKLINGHFKFRAVDMSNVTFINGGYREEIATEIWFSFDGEKPVPTPTVDRRFVETAKPLKKPRR